METTVAHTVARHRPTTTRHRMHCRRASRETIHARQLTSPDAWTNRITSWHANFLRRPFRDRTNPDVRLDFPSVQTLPDCWAKLYLRRMLTSSLSSLSLAFTLSTPWLHATCCAHVFGRHHARPRTHATHTHRWITRHTSHLSAERRAHALACCWLSRRHASSDCSRCRRTVLYAWSSSSNSSIVSISPVRRAAIVSCTYARPSSQPIMAMRL